METIIVAIIGLINNGSAVSAAFGIAALVFGGYLFFRKTNIAEVTSVGTLQQQQITSLLTQIEFLSTELAKARTQLAEIHEQNIHLMEQVRESNKRIQELEQLLGSK